VEATGVLREQLQEAPPLQLHEVARSLLRRVAVARLLEP
jgi:hypothetical protein